MKKFINLFYPPKSCIYYLNSGNTYSQSFEIKGKITNPINIPLKGVIVKLFSDGQILQSTYTDENGKYEFKDLSDLAYKIEPVLNNNFFNGVSSHDLLRITQNILGVSIFDSPYSMIAADVNETKSITSADISEIRKLILGIIDEYRNTQSWIFIPTSHLFLPLGDPWSFNEFIDVDKNNAGSEHDFIGVKKGDVNFTARLN